MNIIVATRIKELMRENNLTQVKLADKIGLKQNTISAWLLGKKEPSIRSLWLLADFFNTDEPTKNRACTARFFRISLPFGRKSSEREFFRYFVKSTLHFRLPFLHFLVGG